MVALWSPARGVLCNVPCSLWLCAVEAARGLCEQTSGQSLAAAKETTNAARERNRAPSSGTAQPSPAGRRLAQEGWAQTFLPLSPCRVQELNQAQGGIGTTTPEMVAMPQTVPTCPHTGGRTDCPCHCHFCCHLCVVKLSHWDPAVPQALVKLGLLVITATLQCCSVSSGIWGQVAGASSQPSLWPAPLCPALPRPACRGKTGRQQVPGERGRDDSAVQLQSCSCFPRLVVTTLPAGQSLPWGQHVQAAFAAQLRWGRAAGMSC